MARKKRKKKWKKKGFRPKRLLKLLPTPLHWLRYRVGEYCLRGFVRVLPWLPVRFLSLLTFAGGRWTYAILRGYRTRMETNLAIAMREELPSPEERKALIRRAWGNFAQGILETGIAMHATKEKIISTVAIEGEEHLKRALARGKGVIALSAHLGNFMMIGIRLGAAGYPFSLVAKQPRDRGFARLIDEYRAQVGIATIPANPRRAAARGVLRALRSNHIVLLIADEFKSGGVEVNFFGLASSVPRGPATLAFRTGAAILPMFATRDANDRLTLRIEPEIELVATDELERDVDTNTALFTGRLEAVVRRYPDQWNWLGFYRDGKKTRFEYKGSQSKPWHSREMGRR